MQVRKKPVEVEARQLGIDYDTDLEIMAWCGGTPIHSEENVTANAELFMIPTLEGQMMASVGDWIVKGVKDEFYPVKPDIFAETYDLLEADEEASN